MHPAFFMIGLVFIAPLRITEDTVEKLLVGLFDPLQRAFNGQPEIGCGFALPNWPMELRCPCPPFCIACDPGTNGSASCFMRHIQ